MSAPTTPAAQVRVLGDTMMDTFVALCEYLGIDPMEAAKLPGKPSEVFISAIESRAAFSAPPAAGVPEGMNRTREQWRALDANLCSRENSQAANFYLIRDAQQDIERLHRALASAPTPPASEQQQAVVPGVSRAIAVCEQVLKNGPGGYTIRELVEAIHGHLTTIGYTVEKLGVGDYLAKSVHATNDVAADRFEGPVIELPAGESFAGCNLDMGCDEHGVCFAEHQGMKSYCGKPSGAAGKARDV